MIGFLYLPHVRFEVSGSRVLELGCSMTVTRIFLDFSKSGDMGTLRAWLFLGARLSAAM